MELKQYLNVVKSKWWILALVIGVCCTAAYVYSAYYVKPVYQASTDLIVNKTAETQNGQQQVDQNSINTNLMLINTYKQIIKSPAIMKQVEQKHPEFNLTAEELNQKFTINSTKDTQVLTLMVNDGSYEKAAQIVNAISSEFREKVTSIMKVNNVSVLNEADPAYPVSPVNDNQRVLMMFSFVVALMLGLGIIFLLDYLDDTVKTEHDIEHELGLTLLTSIPTIRKHDLKRPQPQVIKPLAQSASLHAVKQQR